MWNISSNDVEHAKESIKLRRAEVETRYAKEKEALDAESAVIETLERAASEFALKHTQEQAQVAAEPTVPAEIGFADVSEEKPHSRWRLHLGSRSSDAEATAGSIPTALR